MKQVSTMYLNIFDYVHDIKANLAMIIYIFNMHKVYIYTIYIAFILSPLTLCLRTFFIQGIAWAYDQLELINMTNLAMN